MSLLFFRQYHFHQFGIGSVVDFSVSRFRKIVESGRSFAGNVNAYYLLMGIDNADHGLKLQ